MKLCKCYCSYIIPQFSAKTIVTNGCSYVSSSSQLLLGLLSKVAIYFIFQWFLRKIYSNQKFLCLYPNSYCYLENCKFNILLIGSYFNQTLQRLGNSLFTYQIINFLYTLCKYRLYSNVISSTGEVFNQLDRAVHHNLKWKGAEKMPSVAKKRL